MGATVPRKWHDGWPAAPQTAYQIRFTRRGPSCHFVFEMARRSGSARPSFAVQRPHLYLAHHVGAGEPAGVGRDGDGVDPVLELAAARGAQLLDELAGLGVPDADLRVAAGREEV